MEPTEAAIALGRQVAKVVAKRWLQVRQESAERDEDLINLIAISVRDKLHRRKLARRLEDIGDQVASRVIWFAEQEPSRSRQRDQEITAGLLAVSDSLSEADLTDSVFLQANMTASELARAIRDQMSAEKHRKTLGSLGRRVYDKVLDDCCIQIVHIVRQLPAFTPRAVVELLQRTGTAVDMLDEILSRLPKTSLGGKLGTESADFERAYLEHLGDTLDELEIFGVNTRRYKPRTLVTAAYVTLSVSIAEIDPFESPLYRRGKLKLGTTALESRALNAETALALNNQTLLLGDAGSGKTTLLKWIALNAARSTFEGPLAAWNGLVPFYVKLRSFANSPLPSMDQIVSDTVGALSIKMPSNWAEEIFQTRRAILLVDGVDELPAPKRDSVRLWLRAFLKRRPEMPIVVASRPAAVEPSWLNQDGFITATLEPMSPADIAVFCQKWHIAIGEAARRGATVLPCAANELPAYEKSILRQLEARRHLRNLAANPLMCAMLCALNLDRRQNLPLDRIKLYQEALDLLLDRRDFDREIDESVALPNISAKVKLSVLQYLAWRYMCSDRSEMPSDVVEELIEAALKRTDAGAGVVPRIMRRLLVERSGVLREPSFGTTDFIHRTFQEYLAAQEAANDHQIEFLVANSHRDQWSETIVMTAGLATIPNQARLISGLLDRSGKARMYSRRLLLLAAACLDTATSISPDLVARVENALDPLFPPKRRTEARSLAVGSRRSFSRLPRKLDDLAPGMAVACIQTAVYMNEDDTLELLGQYANDDRPQIQFELMQMWRYFDLETYARTVLKNAPLLDGKVLVDDARYVPYLHNLTNARSLAIDIADEVPDLEFLSATALALVKLKVATAHPIAIDKLLRYRHLRELDISGAGVCEPESLQRLATSLEALSIAGVTARDALPYLINLRALHKLEFDEGGGIESLFPLGQLVELEELAIGECPSLREATEIRDHPSLRSLTLTNGSLRGGLEALGGLARRLHTLRLDGCSTVDDVRPLQKGQLHELYLWECDVNDVAPLLRVPTLRDISLIQLPLDNVDVLSKLPNLRRLHVADSCPSIDLRKFASRTKKLDLIVGHDQILVGRPPANVRIMKHGQVRSDRDTDFEEWD
jgi:NACHT N-terminal Helical domain 1/NACHT domain